MRIANTLIALALVNCLACGGDEPPDTPPAAAAQPSTAAPSTIPFTVAPGLPEWSSTYVATHLADGNTATQWFTPRGPSLPVQATLRLATPASVGGVDLDNSLGSYNTSGVREVQVDLLGPADAVVASARVVLHQGATTSIGLPPAMTSAVRLTMHSNHGGDYLGLAGVTLRPTRGSGQPPLPVAAPAPATAPPPATGIPYTVAPGLPQWNTTYAVAGLNDGTPSTQWYTPMNPTLPVTATLRLASPRPVSAVTFDTHLGSYATSALRDAQIELLDATGAVIGNTNASLPQQSTTRVPVTSSGATSQVRITMRSSHGGSYLGLAELRLD